jgi:hypothetical protein
MGSSPVSAANFPNDNQMNDTTTIKKSLLCSLTDEERRTCGITLATTLEDITRIEAEKKAQSDHYKNRIAGLQAAADQLTHKVSTGQEWREIECKVVFGQPTPHHKQIVRIDTGEVVGTEMMSAFDQQRELPLVIEGDDEGDDEDTADDADDGVIDVESEPVEQDWAETAVDAPPVEVVGKAPPDYRVPPSTGYKTKKENAAFNAGFRAYSRDKDLEIENPYDSADLKKTALSFAWADGWDNAALFVAAGGSWRDEPLPTDDAEAPQPAPDSDDY